MKFSIVTISFNQAQFLRRTLDSVLAQEGVDLEYIVVDPGSSDGSRDIIDRYKDQISKIIFEADRGPADGLNLGFSHATGDIFGYLNSDDTLEPGALTNVAEYFRSNEMIDVVSGNAWLIDPADRKLRKLWSDKFDPKAFAFGASTLIQPSTFIRANAFRRSGGFNVENRSNWDGELAVDLHLSGSKFGKIDQFLSSYRLHEVSITNSGSLHDKIQQYQLRMFEKLMGRSYAPWDDKISALYRAIKHVRNPRAALERLLRGPVYRRGI